MTAEEQAEMTAVTDLVADRIKNLITAHYEAIRSLAEDEDNEGVVKISASIELDFSGKKPVGAVNIGFSKRVTDGCTFAVDQDPELPLA